MRKLKVKKNSIKYKGYVGNTQAFIENRTFDISGTNFL
jgi:hypothetical protein